MTEPIWNVRVTVVDLVPAATAEAAIAKLHRLLEATGVDLYPDETYESDAYESEPLGPDVEADVRTTWKTR